MKSMGRVFAVLALAAGAAPSVLAATCSVRDKVPSTARVLAKTSDQAPWSEYRSLQDVPDLTLSGGTTALVVLKKSGSVTIVKPGQTFWIYTRYCYGEDGALGGVGFEVRTYLGWGYRMEGSALQGGFSANSREFFRTKDGKTIRQPEGVADAPMNLQPTLYLSLDKLPFAALIKTTARAHGKHDAAPALAKASN